MKKQINGIVTAAAITAAGACALPTQGSTVSYWTLDAASGNYVDNVGGNDLTRSGGTQDTANAAIINSGLSNGLNNQDASDSRTTNPASQTALRGYTGHIGALDLSSTGWTMEMYLRTSNTGRAFLASNNPSGNSSGHAWDLELNRNSSHLGQLNFRILEDANHVVDFFGSSNIADNEFHHIAVTWDPNASANGLVSLYVDGALDASHAGLGDIGTLNSGHHFYIGGFLLTGDTFTSTLGTTGQIDEVRISDAVLAPGQFLNAVPEPASLSLLGLGSVLLWRRR